MSFHSFTEYYDEKIYYSKFGKKKNRTNTGKKKHEKGFFLQSHDTIHHYQLSYQISLLKLVQFHGNLLRKIIQNMERKKIGQTQGRIRRRALVSNPMIQHITIDLYTKNDSSSLHVCGEIFDEKKIERTDGRTDGRTDERKDGLTEINQYKPHFFKQGYNNNILRIK